MSVFNALPLVLSSDQIVALSTEGVWQTFIGLDKVLSGCSLSICVALGNFRSTVTSNYFISFAWQTLSKAFNVLFPKVSIITVSFSAACFVNSAVEFAFMAVLLASYTYFSFGVFQKSESVISLKPVI